MSCGPLAVSRLQLPSTLASQRTARTYATTTHQFPGRAKLENHDFTKARRPKKEGTIADVFVQLISEAPPLPERFSDLKKELFTEKLVHSWKEVLSELEIVTEEVAVKGGDVLPRVAYSDVVRGLSKEQVDDIKRVGAVVIKGGVPVEEALAWKQQIREYVAANQDKVKGRGMRIPPDKIVFYELYNSKAQIAARTHPALINSQKALLKLWHSSDPETAVSLATPISYFDRLRICDPGPSIFTLGPHIDGGSLERWEDPGFRSCFQKILSGRWKEHDSFDMSPRLNANQDLYHAPNQCSIFRPWQGWTSLSTTGARQGTLQLLPFLSLATAYIMLRPFFRLRPDRKHTNGTAIPLEADAWEVNLDGTEFPGSMMGKAQQMNEETHPHLRLDKALVSLPEIQPGDQVYWHCDLVHAVERKHSGKSDSSVLYIPAVPLTLKNAAYLRDQRETFIEGLPSPDFPGGEGETSFIGRSTLQDVQTAEGRRVLGLEPFDIPAETTPASAKLIKQANSILF
ncbi:DUF1479-domain-containing protein [Panus rudis PR-1116 ss-1]|nr:DUF1479-domain-containing protein [Panus rudis PR-1116 ss-1]